MSSASGDAALRWLGEAFQGDKPVSDSDAFIAGAQVHATLAVVEALDELREQVELLRVAYEEAHQ